METGAERATTPASGLASTLVGRVGPVTLLLLALGCLALEQMATLVLWKLGLHASALIAAATLGVLVPVGVMTRAAGLPLLAGVGLHRPGGRHAGIAAAVTLAALPPAYALAAVGRNLFPPAPGQFEFYADLVPTGVGSFLLGLAAVVLVVPLAEEVLFRGLVQPSLVPWVRPAAAVGISAALFAAVHGALWMLLPLTFLGISLGLVALHAGSLTPAWIGHGLFNAVAFVELCLSHDVDSTRLESWASPPAVWAPSSVLLLVLLASVVPRCGKITVGSDDTPDRTPA